VICLDTQRFDRVVQARQQNEHVGTTSSAISSPASAAFTPHGAPVRLLAFADESMRRVNEHTVCYFMAAAVIPEDHCPHVRDTLKALVPGRQGKLHWRDEAQPRRELITKTIRACAVESLVVVGAMVNPRKQERARRLVLRHLLHTLDIREVAHVVLESRHAERDRHDIAAIGGFRNAGVVSRRLAVSHAQPLQEPMLWVPDAVAGAAGDHSCGVRICLDMLGELVEMLDIGTI
jgi:hypothetical protein